MRFFKLLILFVILFVASCNKSKQGTLLEHVLELSKNNRTELEKVLTHYSTQPEDSLKYQAAVFLIENMYTKFTLDSLSIAHNQPYFDALTAYRDKNGGYGEEAFYLICDSVKAISDLIYSQILYRPELQTIKSDFLINHIDHSFHAWQQSLWANELDFSLFLEYILPYRVKNSYWEGSNLFFDQKYNRIRDDNPAISYMEVARYISEDIDSTFRQEYPALAESYSFLLPATFENLAKAQIGLCEDANAYKTSALRSQGIPAAFNILPCWGNSNASHFLTEIIGDTTKRIYNNQQMEYIHPEDELINAMYWYKVRIPTYEGIPSHITVQSCRTVPKLYRLTYKVNPRSLYYSDKNIPNFFKNYHLEDITSTYIQTANIKIPLRKVSPSQKYAYLCCYDANDWTPVAWAPTKRKHVTFQDMGVNILYLPAYYVDNKLTPAGNPFLVSEEGIIKELAADTIHAISEAAMYSKTPYRTSSVFQASTLLGGRFQLANKRDLSDTITIHTIQDIIHYERTIDVNLANSFRYAVFQFSGIDYLSIGELKFFGKNSNGQDTLLHGEIIGNKGINKNPAQDAFDNDRVSYFFYNPEEKETYLGLDLGKAQSISQIKIFPRSDDNRIVTDELYELFYWNNGKWISLGKQYGKENKLVYKNIPANALFYIHNHTQGKEHRPFTYDNDRQVWW